MFRILIVLLSSCLTTSVLADGMSYGQTHYKVRGADEYCANYQGQCPVGLTGRDYALLSEIRGLLPDINSSVNFQIKYELKEVYSWNVLPVLSSPGPKQLGVCNEYAVTKKARLIAAGIPAKALRLAFVMTENKVGHLVLVVVLKGRPNLVLDNRLPYPTEYYKLPYRWVSWQTAEDPRKWVSVDFQ